MPSSFKVGGATKMPVGAGVVCTETTTQGYAGGAREILSNHLNCKTRVVDDALGFSVLQSETSDPVLFDIGLCNNVIHDEAEHSSPISTKSALDLGAKEYCSSSVAGDIRGARVFNTKGLKKRKRRLSRKQDRRPGADKKRTSFNHSEYRAAHGNMLPSNQNTIVVTSSSNRGHSPTKAEVKMMNQRLIDENHRLKKDFHKANHRLKSLLADKKDLLRRLRMESKTSNRLIESIQLEANDMMKRSRDIFADANRCKIETELLNDEIETSQDVLLRERQDLRKQSARLKKQAARMTETHKRRKTALADQRKEMERDVNTEKQRWNISIRLAEKKMMSSLKQLQNERVMWQVLSQEAELRCDDAKLEVHRQKSNGRTLVQMQVDKAIRKERELKSYMFELQEIHAVQLLSERKANRAAIQSSKYW